MSSQNKLQLAKQVWKFTSVPPRDMFVKGLFDENLQPTQQTATKKNT